jgi:hypothetical protein
MRILELLRSKRPNISSLLSETDSVPKEAKGTRTHRFPDYSEPIFENTRSLSAEPYYSALTNEQHNGQRIIEIFFDKNSTTGPRIGFRLHKVPVTPVETYRDPDKPFQGFGSVEEYNGEDEVASKVYIAYTRKGELKLSEVDYRKGNTPIEKNLNDPEMAGLKDELIKVLNENKEKFLAPNSGIPKEAVEAHIKPVYDKLEGLVAYQTPYKRAV